MKKRFLASILTFVMAFSTCISTLHLTTLAEDSYSTFRYDDPNYSYGKTTDLEAKIITNSNGEEVATLTWPAVDKEGNLINANPLTSTSAYGNPTGGWTNPVTGMIIQYDNWSVDGSTKANNVVHTGDFNILYGVTDQLVSDSPLVITSYVDGVETYHSNAYLNTEVVATSFATAYRIEYSTDGINWNIDHNVTTYNHGKKLNRPADNDKGWAADPNTTFFLEDQLTETIASTLAPETEYQIKVTAYNQAAPASYSTPFKVFQTKITTPAEAEKTEAFPSVEGSGKFSQGGRGGDVYVVTNLTDSVTNPQPGSLRYGLERRDRTDGNKTAPRTIVFAVGGTIHIDPSAGKSARRFNINSNTTIAGQTAPGEGITIAGAGVKIDGENIIIRYIRCRLGDGYDQDAATASGKNIVIDHCTLGWGVDETFTAKELINSSIQYNIIANGLAIVDKNGDNNTDAELNSAEGEAKHGMGSMLNGYEASITHNLWAHNGTRNPRFEGSFNYNNTNYTNKMEFSNNVIYNWGHNSSYGGDRGEALVNFTNNYYKPGPNTLEKVKAVFFDCDTSASYGGVKSSYYMNGNYMYDNPAITADNAQGFKDLAICANVLSSPVELAIPYTAESAEDAYSHVIESVGASFVRDAHDNRLINQVKTGTGSFINSDAEAGGYDSTVYTSDLTDTDQDGMPDEWETKMGLNPNDKTDAGEIITGENSPYFGYSNIEVYINDIIGEWDGQLKTNTFDKTVSIDSITDSSNNNLIKADGTTTLVSNEQYQIAIPSNSSTDIIYEVYLNDQILGTITPDKPLTASFDKLGAYNLILKLTDKNNTYNSTFSNPVTVTIVGGTQNLENFTAQDIGAPRLSGQSGYDPATGALVIGGAGLIGRTSNTSAQSGDAFHYNYTQVTGDLEMVAKIDNWSRIDYYQKAGLMIRNNLEPNSEFYMAAFTYLKGENYKDVNDASGGAVKAKNIMSFARRKQGTDTGTPAVSEGKCLSIPLARISQPLNYGWAKITRVGQTVTLSASIDGSTWHTLNTYETTLPETCYIGFAVDAVQDPCDLNKYNVAQFTDISLSEAPISTLLGDVDCDGVITANDAALIMQYVLNSSSVQIAPQGLLNAKVTGDDTYTADNAAQILQKSLNNTYKFTIEQINKTI